MLKMINSLCKVSVGIYVLLLTVSFSHAQTVEPMKILFIGNSFTHMNNMPGIFEKIALKAGKNVSVVKNTKSGASFRVHSERSDMYEAIKSRKWDYVILQGWSREFVHPVSYLDTATMPYLMQITDSIYSNNACTNILFYMSWGYQDGYPDVEAINTYDKMTDTIAKGYQYVSEVFNSAIVPVGMVWREVRSQSDINLYTSDMYHPNINGSYLIATTFYEAIFNESIEKIYTSTISAANAQLIKRVTHSYLSSSRDKFKLNNNRFDIKPHISAKGEYVLEVKSNFPNASSIKWRFGDGNTSDKANTKYVFKSAGSYKVKLAVTDECGTRNYERMLHFEKPEKPSFTNPKKPKYNIGNTKKL